ncbi:MAG: ArsC family reductase [Stappiaceae bacterium]
MKLFGIGNCDKVKKARRWLKDNGLACDFHDYKKAGVDLERLKAHVDKFGWETVLNRKGTTWRKLSDEEKAAVVDAVSATRLLQANSSMIKRPILETDEDMLIDFDEQVWEKQLK